MQAYLNDENLKQRVIAGLKAHYDADEIIKGVYWENGKGGALGCILHDLDKDKDASSQARFESELGIPRLIGRLINRIFEALPNQSAKEFPLEIMHAIQTGSNLNYAWPKFAIWLLTDIDDGVIKFAKNNQQSEAIKNVAELYKRKINNELISVDEWKKAADAAVAYGAYGAYAYAADAAASADAAAAVAYAAAVYAAAYAAYTAYAADASVYDAAADTAAYTAAYAIDAAAYAAYPASQSHYEKVAEKLIEIVNNET